MLEPGFYGLIDIASERTVLFMPRLNEIYATFMGELETLEQVRVKYDVEEVHYNDEVMDRAISAGFNWLSCRLLAFWMGYMSMRFTRW